MNVGGALTTIGDETIVSGSRLEVAKSLTNSMVNGFSSMYFNNVNSTATPTETGQIFRRQSGGLNLCTNTAHPIRLCSNRGTAPTVPSIEISGAGTKTYLSMRL